MDDILEKFLNSAGNNGNIYICILNNNWQSKKL